ncbi:MAG: NAD(P)H-hydrate dehydratase [Candidatus Aenigmarchaeota archaeon]|nr:NAD(P)H-hydrate dehydratase [Candidatus Aenigmarchaeota archaeon]
MIENPMKRIYSKRGKNSHKFNFGHLLVIGGSKKYSGSPAFASLAAYRTGVDLVTTMAPRRAADIIATFSPDLITVPLKGDYFEEKHIKEVEKIKNFSAVVIGGGLERKKETFRAVNKFLKKLNKPCVIDADAIHAISKNKKIIKNKLFVLTPHLHEFKVLTGTDVKGLDLNEKKKIVERSANKIGCIILLKGNPDIISDGHLTKINKTGNPYMTVGGTGDVLAGVIGSLLSQGATPFDAAMTGAYMTGKVGDLVAKTKKESMTASDLIDNFYKIF